MAIDRSATPRHRLWLTAITVALTAVAVLPRGAEAQTGTLTGRVVDAQSGVPIPTAQVTVAGTTLGSAVDNGVLGRIGGNSES
jgi:hypothetical protein